MSLSCEVGTYDVENSCCADCDPEDSLTCTVKTLWPSTSTYTFCNNEKLGTDYDYYYDYQDEALRAAIIAAIVTVLLIWICTFVGFYFALRNLRYKEEHLPKERRKLTPGVVVGWGLGTLCGGVFGLLIIYVVLSNQIQSAVNRYDMDRFASKFQAAGPADHVVPVETSAPVGPEALGVAQDIARV